MTNYTETTSRITVNVGYAWPTSEGFHGYRLTKHGIVIYECYLANIDQPVTAIQFIWSGKLIERTWPVELSQNQITRRVNKLVADVVTNQPTISGKEQSK